MNFTPIIIILIVESILLGILGIAKKLTKKVFLIVSVISILLGFIALMHMDKKNTANESLSQKEYIYISGKLMEEGFFKESLNVLAVVEDAGNDEYYIVPLRGLGYNLNDAFLLAATYLEAVDNEDAKAIYESSLAKEEVDEDLQDKVIEISRDSLALSEDEIKKLDFIVSSMYPTLIGNDEESPSGINQNGLENVKALIADNKYNDALEVMKIRADNDANEGIILAEMYVSDYDCRDYSEEDEAYDSILDEITKAQVEKIRDGQDFDEDADDENPPIENKDYYASSALLSSTEDELYEESIRRAINYLESIDKTRITDKCAYDLEMAYLYYRIHDEDSTKEFLDMLFTEAESEGSDVSRSNVYRECVVLEDVYSMYLGDSASPDFDVSFDQLFSALYGNIYESGFDPGFRAFILKYLKDRIGGLRISSIDTSGFPVIKATVYSTREDVSINEDNLTIIDTGDPIENLSVIKEDIGTLSICYVFDVSGSMGGSRIIEAKDAIHDSVLLMGESTEVALVSFNSKAKEVCPLTLSKNTLVGMLDGLEADGGTSIASGIICGCEALSDAQGPKAIILISDGYDGDEGALTDALSMARKEGIPIFTIGLSSGCDKEYLSKIAEETEGVFTQVDNVRYLSDEYFDIRSYLQTRYIVTYTCSKEEAEYRYLLAGISNTSIKVRKAYNTLSSGSEESDPFSSVQQQSDFFMETGGTLSTGGEN